MPKTARALSIRVPQSLIKRLDALIPTVAGDPWHHAASSVSRSDVARVALLRGIEALESGLTVDAGQVCGAAAPEPASLWGISFTPKCTRAASECSGAHEYRGDGAGHIVRWGSETRNVRPGHAPL